MASKKYYMFGRRLGENPTEFERADKENKRVTPGNPTQIFRLIGRYLTIKSYPLNRRWRPVGLWDVKDPTLPRKSAHS
jgi:hypothetical protein